MLYFLFFHIIINHLILCAHIILYNTFCSGLLSSWILYTSLISTGYWIYTYFLLPPCDKELLLCAYVEAVKWHGGPVFENCFFFQNQLSRCFPDIYLRMGIDPFFNCSFFEYETHFSLYAMTIIKYQPQLWMILKINLWRLMSLIFNTVMSDMINSLFHFVETPGIYILITENVIFVICFNLSIVLGWIQWWPVKFCPVNLVTNYRII